MDIGQGGGTAAGRRKRDSVDGEYLREGLRGRYMKGYNRTSPGFYVFQTTQVRGIFRC